MDYAAYIAIEVALGGLFFATALYAFFWAVRDGQFRRFDKAAVSIFDREEPPGVQTDHFPRKAEDPANSSKR